MNADFPDKCFDNDEATITVENKVNEPRQGGGSNFGQNTHTFTVFNAKELLLQAQTTQATGTTFEPAGQAICTEDIDNALCRVMPNEVIAITVPGSKAQNGKVSWTVNNQPYTCDASISNACANDQNTKTIIVPMRGQEGEHITVAAHIQDITTDTNHKADIARTFRITAPSVSIVPMSGGVAKVVGVDRNTKKEQFIRESDTAITATSPTVTLGAKLYPTFLNTPDDTIHYAWTVDGKDYGNTATISIAPEQLTNVAVRVTRGQSYEDRDVLSTVFGVAPQASVPTTFTATTTVTAQDTSTLASASQNGFFATAAANAPAYFLFILKMTLLMAVMLIVPSAMLSLRRE